MKIFKCFIILVSFNFCLMSCMTPINDKNLLNELTTCKHGSLDRVKQNLTLMGYDIIKYDDNSLSTDFKQDTTGYSKKLYTRVYVAKLTPKLIRFKVREKRIQRTVESDTSHISASGVETSTHGSISHKHGDASIVSYRNGTNKDEYDFVYYQEKLDEYRNFRDQVCEISE